MTRRPASPARVLMIQGTASHAGKSTLAAALCRLFAREGWRVAPFKAQNISLNAAVARGGGEIGVAQAVQARAAGVDPAVEMNPVLVKPAAGGRTQIVVLGRAAPARPPRVALWRAIAGALDTLRARYDLIIAEGAGSPAEVNLRRSDLTNMRVARYAKAPVLLVGDIDRGGVFAALAGTVALLERTDRALVAGFVINKFRGDARALRPAIRDLEARTRRPVLGVVPYAPAWRLPEEDAVALDQRRRPGGLGESRDGGDPETRWLEIAVLHLPYISNFDEFSALEQEPGVRLRYVGPGQRLGRPDLVILPGSKSTVADLEVLRRSGLADAVRQAREAGTPILGICGGYQMLGRRIDDPHGVESDRRAVEGLGLLPAATEFATTKRTARVRVRLGASPPHRGGLLGAWPDVEAQGYEIHMGRSASVGRTTSAPGPAPGDAPRRAARGTDGAGAAWIRVVERSGRRCDEPAGAASSDGLVCGTAVHGLLEHPAVRRALLDALWARCGTADAAARWEGERRVLTLDERIDGLADLVARHVDLDRIRAIAGLRRE